MKEVRRRRRRRRKEEEEEEEATVALLSPRAKDFLYIKTKRI